MFIGSELFRQGPRPKAMAVVGLALWIASFVIAIGFEPLQVSHAVISLLQLLIRPTDDSRKPLYFTAVLFCLVLPDPFPERGTVSCRKKHPMLGPTASLSGHARNTDSNISSSHNIYSLTLFWPRFSIQVAFDSSCLQKD